MKDPAKVAAGRLGGLANFAKRGTKGMAAVGQIGGLAIAAKLGSDGMKALGKIGGIAKGHSPLYNDRGNQKTSDGTTGQNPGSEVVQQ
jgi:hypothetical protein